MQRSQRANDYKETLIEAIFLLLSDHWPSAPVFYVAQMNGRLHLLPDPGARGLLWPELIWGHPPAPPFHHESTIAQSSLHACFKTTAPAYPSTAAGCFMSALLFLYW